MIGSYEFPQLESTAVLSNPADVLSEAWAEAERLRDQARREGEAAGYEDGLARAREQTAPLAQALRTAVADVHRAEEELAQSLTAEAAELAIAIAEQILGAEVALRPERVLDVTRGALRRITDRGRVVVQVNPEDLELVSGSAALLRSELGGIEHLDVQADRRLARGGAVVHTDLGEIDASLEAQLTSVRELVAAAVHGEAPATPGETPMTPGPAPTAP